MPSENIDTYMEPFSGMYWVYLRSYINSESSLTLNAGDIKRVIYNDLNKNNVNLFRVLKYQIKELSEYIKNVKVDIMDLNFFNEAKDFLFQYSTDINEFDLMDKGDLERVLYYVYMACHVFSGTSIKENSSMPKLKGASYLAFNKRINNHDYIKKLTGITNVDNNDFQVAIEKYDSNKSFYYVDPPYFQVNDYTVDSFDDSINEHERLANCLKKTKARWMLSYYDFDELEDLYPRNDFIYMEKDYTKRASLGTGTKKNTATEVLIFNYNCNDTSK